MSGATGDRALPTKHQVTDLLKDLATVSDPEPIQRVQLTPEIYGKLDPTSKITSVVIKYRPRDVQNLPGIRPAPHTINKIGNTLVDSNYVQLHWIITGTFAVLCCSHLSVLTLVSRRGPHQETSRT